MRTTFHYLALFCKLLMMIPAALTSTVSSFFTMKHVKTYLRRKTAEDRLSYICLLISEQSLSSSPLKDFSELNHQSVCYVKAQACFIYSPN